MFSVHCPEAGTEVLLGPRSVLSMHNTSQGIVGYFRCRCGTLGVVVTGRGSMVQTSYHPARDEVAVPSHDAVPVTVPADALVDCA